MLTADLVHVRRRGDRLVVVPVAPSERPRALELASAALALVRAHLGLPRGALLEAWSQVAVAPTENRLARALFKLALDACEFEEGDTLDPVELRRDLFTQAAAARRDVRDFDRVRSQPALGTSLPTLPPPQASPSPSPAAERRGRVWAPSQGAHFDRAALLADVARARGMDPEALEEALYSDLPSAHVLRKADLPSPDGLLAQHELSCHQAVLLRAVNVRARIFSASAGGYRALFRKLKFHRLLYTISKLDRVRSQPASPAAERRGRVWEHSEGSHLDRGKGYAIDIDGPYSLFEQTTKYGLNLALALPAIMACDAWELEAELRWGKD